MVIEEHFSSFFFPTCHGKVILDLKRDMSKFSNIFSHEKPKTFRLKKKSDMKIKRKQWRWKKNCRQNWLNSSYSRKYIWNFFWGHFLDPMVAVWCIISAGSNFRRVKIEWCGHIYIYSGRPTFFCDLHTPDTFCRPLSELNGFAWKTLFLKFQQMCLLCATKNLKIFSEYSLVP